MAKDYVERMQKEHKKLNEKIEALIDFIQTSEVYENMSQTDQQLMDGQAAAMVTYGTFLGLRINRATSKGSMKKAFKNATIIEADSVEEAVEKLREELTAVKKD